MTSEATLYEDARIDAALITALNGAGDEPFWRMAYASAIHRTRSMALLACDGETSLHEVAALLGNDTVLKALVEAGAARSTDAERERRARTNRLWLESDWPGLDHNLRNHIVEGIREAAASTLTVTGTPGGANAVTLGERRGPWLDGGRLRWSIAPLPAHIREAVETAVDELRATACAAEKNTPAETGPSEATPPARSEADDSLRRNIINVIENAVVAASCLRAITVDESQRMKAEIAQWRARLRPPGGNRRGRRTTRRQTATDAKPGHTAPAAPAAAQSPQRGSA